MLCIEESKGPQKRSSVVSLYEEPQPHYGEAGRDGQERRHTHLTANRCSELRFTYNNNKCTWKASHTHSVSQMQPDKEGTTTTIASTSYGTKENGVVEVLKRRAKTNLKGFKFHGV